MQKMMLAAALAALCVPVSASAQEMKAERMQNVSFHMVEMIKFKPGKRDRAMEIIRDYFVPADKGIGGQVVDLHLQTGPWDAIVVFPMSGGPGDLSWQTSPDEIKWMTALGQKAGGADKAKALMTEWDTLVERSEYHVAHQHTGQ